jgi:hypothetical protein
VEPIQQRLRVESAEGLLQDPSGHEIHGTTYST